MLIAEREQLSGLAEPLGPAEVLELVLPQAARLVKMAAAAAAVMMRRMETVPTPSAERRSRPMIVGAKAYRFRHVYPSTGLAG
ncbi:MAG TPA: hypothetical protein VMV17_08780 [Streptosporangiaceae bacterium]|nr:hypothetical protein [Streptosporangiaceae bacterium]